MTNESRLREVVAEMREAVFVRELRDGLIRSETVTEWADRIAQSLSEAPVSGALSEGEREALERAARLLLRDAREQAAATVCTLIRRLSEAPAQGGECCVPPPIEPKFVLLGRDPQAPALLRQWADDRERAEPDSNKPQKARDIAESMAAWKHANPDIGMAREKLAHPPAASEGTDIAAIRSVISQLRAEKYMRQEERDSTNYTDLHEGLADELAAAIREGKP